MDCSISVCAWKKAESKWCLCYSNSQVYKIILKDESPAINGNGKNNREVLYRECD